MAVLRVAAFGAFLAFLDSTIVNIAFPAIQSYFHGDLGSLSWVLNAYNIAAAVLDNLPVATLAGEEGPLIAVSVRTGSQARPGPTP
jgi:MFS family permease